MHNSASIRFAPWLSVCLGAGFCLNVMGESPTSNWLDWRGPTLDGRVAPDASPPLEWDEESGKNIAWKTPIHGQGHSSPCVLDGHAWVTAATEDGTEMSLVIVDLADGAIVFDEVLLENMEPEPLSNPVNNYAAPSATSDGNHVFVHFGSYGTFCFDPSDPAAPAEVWKRDDLECRHYRGPGSSPVVWGELVILTFDGVDQQYVTGLNKSTGETVWKTERSTPWDDIGPDGKPEREGDMRKSFSTPIIAEVGGAPQLVSIASKCFFGYDPATGEEQWKHFHGLGHTSSSRPLVVGQRAFLNTGYGKAQLVALDLGDAPSGELPDDARSWIHTKRIPNQSSPVFYEGLLFMVDDGGVGSCLDAESGETMWEERLAAKHSASPVLAGNRIYFFDKEGTATVVAASKEFEVLASNKLEEGLGSPPAVIGGAILVRTEGHLYRLEASEQGE